MFAVVAELADAHVWGAHTPEGCGGLSPLDRITFQSKRKSASSSRISR